MLKFYVAALLMLSYLSGKAQLKTDSAIVKNQRFKTMLGINAFEWDFLQDPKNPNDGMHIYEPKMEVVNSFGGVRHYLDWEKVEAEKGKYSFNPTTKGGWNLDAMYQSCKDAGLEVLVCFKTCPDWLLQSYPSNQRDPENVPAPFGSNRQKPAAYIDQAKAAFQFAARYGSNKSIDSALVSVNTTPRWTGDQVNEVKTGMDLIKYIECDNERDKWWKGDKAHQTAFEYAANLSAFYDGDKGKLGKGVGVKAADPAMQVVMAGLAAPDVKYIAGMIDWCKLHRGYKPDGTVDLCFDVINFHFYANDHKLNAGDKRTVGVAPELSEAGEVADEFVKLANLYHLEVWVTEAGYDINPNSPQRAIKIGDKTALVTQADWILRTALLFARHNIKKLFFYELYDSNFKDNNPYSSSGLATGDQQRRPAADYILQTKNLMGDFKYLGTINKYPLVDVYTHDRKKMYVLTVPAETGKELLYTLKINDSKSVIVHYLKPGNNEMDIRTLAVINNEVHIKVTETPVFVEDAGDNL